MIQTNYTINNDLFNGIDKSNKINSTYSLPLNGNIPFIQYQIINIESKENINETSSIETYNDIPDYEGHYQVSDKGNIKSLKQNKETVLKPSIDKKGYYKVSLYKEGESRKVYIHRLVIRAFKGEIPKGKNLVVDHIDNDKTNNELDNLQVISNRENLSKDKWRYNPSSLYTGVCYSSRKKKWESSISVNGVSFHLGYFNNEVNAALEYVNALEYNNEHSDLTNYPFKTKKRILFSNDLNQLTIDFC